MKYTTQKKKQLIEAYRKTMCNVTLACRNVGISRTLFYQWLNDHPELKEEIDDCKHEEKDFIENALMKRIEAGDTTAIIFACKTQLRDRGYVEKQEVELSGNPFEALMKKLPDLSDND